MILQILISIVIVLFILLTLIRSFGFPLLKSLLLALQLAAIYFVWHPSKFIRLEQIVELKISSDIAIYTLVLILFFAVISVYLKSRQQSEHITQLVRHIVIQSARKPDNS